MSKGKFRLFGFINPVDIILLAAAVVLVWGAYVFSAPRETAASDQDQKVRYIVELGARREGFYQQAVPGETLYDSIRGLVIGTVVDSYALPFWREAPDEAENIIRRASVEGLEFTYIIVEAYARVSDYETLIGQYDIMVNKQVFVRAKSIAGEGYITHVFFD